MLAKVLKYSFEPVTHCEMCGAATITHKVLGQRLNQSQGLRPKSKSGISVSVKKCTNCQLIYCSPIPIPENIQDHYGVPPEDYWDASYFDWPDYFARQLTTLNQLAPIKPGARALDIGAGLGKCMVALQEAGFDAYGLEASQPFYDRALQKMKISPDRIQLGMMEDLEYEKDFYDFITFGAVLEHLYHPAKSLEKALGWLKPAGIIHVEVPSSRYLISLIINTYYRLIGTNYVTNISPMHEPYHLYEFSLRSFEALSKKLNFQIALVQYDVGNIHGFPKLVHFILKKYMGWTKTGMQLIVWLRKN